jgi:hypothetical protein
MMEAVSTSETLVYFHETTRSNIPEGCHLRQHENQPRVSISSVVKTEQTNRLNSESLGVSSSQLPNRAVRVGLISVGLQVQGHTVTTDQAAASHLSEDPLHVRITHRYTPTNKARQAVRRVKPIILLLLGLLCTPDLARAIQRALTAQLEPKPTRGPPAPTLRSRRTATCSANPGHSQSIWQEEPLLLPTFSAFGSFQEAFDMGCRSSQCTVPS